MALVAGLALSGPALAMDYAADLAPEAEGATGSGTTQVAIDLELLTMRIQADFSGLSGTVSAAHIHCCTLEPGTGTAGVATQTPTLSGFPSGVMQGTYDMVFDLMDTATFNASFVASNGGTAAGATAALVAGLDAGLAYLNIHTSTFGGGEIRGFPTSVPEPAAAALILLAGAALLRRRGAARLA